MLSQCLRAKGKLARDKLPIHRNQHSIEEKYLRWELLELIQQISNEKGLWNSRKKAIPC